MTTGRSGAEGIRPTLGRRRGRLRWSLVQVLVAPDKFKGTATARQAADALAAGLRSAGHEVVCQPLADGGEGTLEVLGGANRTTLVTGPLGDPVLIPRRGSVRSEEKRQPAVPLVAAGVFVVVLVDAAKGMAILLPARSRAAAETPPPCACQSGNRSGAPVTVG